MRTELSAAIDSIELYVIVRFGLIQGSHFDAFFLVQYISGLEMWISCRSWKTLFALYYINYYIVILNSWPGLVWLGRRSTSLVIIVTFTVHFFFFSDQDFTSLVYVTAYPLGRHNPQDGKALCGILDFRHFFFSPPLSSPTHKGTMDPLFCSLTVAQVHD